MTERSQERTDHSPERGIVVSLLPDSNLLEDAARSDRPLITTCGGTGQCGKCRVRFETTAPSAGDRDRHFLSQTELEEGWRLACQLPADAHGVVFLPETSLEGQSHQIMTASFGLHKHSIDPHVRKVFITMERPGRQDSDADMLRVEKAWHEACPEAEGRPLHASLPLLQQLGEKLRQASYQGTITVRHDELLDFEAGDSSQEAYALAFDLGTTTLVGSLLHMQTGKELGLCAEMNPLIAWGDDVISRIAAASADEAVLKEMQEALQDRVAVMAQTLIAEAGVSADHVYEAVFAGNTSMEHFYCGFNVNPLGYFPFVSLFARGHSHMSREAGLPIHGRARNHMFPTVGGFVGGDTVAALLATNFMDLGGTRLLVDVGTNGEMVLAHGDQCLAVSTAAGPAFEGARISRGMRAALGAIERVDFLEDGPRLSVIGGGEARGICGSGLIDLCGELLRTGVVDCRGRLTMPEGENADFPSFPASRLRQEEGAGMHFIVYESPGVRIALTQKDIRELQLGTAALRTGMTLLLQEVGLPLEALDHLIIAGGFGSYIRIEPARRIGLIPGTLPRERIQVVGNAALDGAKGAALSQRKLRQAEHIARSIRHIDLSASPDFAETFAMATIFPDAGVLP
jgi:uncharacterized 2Fe-2S/4Fe-4S cluster protein (DUF4445 family)